MVALYSLEIRRGFASIYLCILLIIVFGMVSLGADWGRVQVAKMELHSAADAAARAACLDLPNGISAVQTAALQAAASNNCDGSVVSLNASTDVVFGTWNPNSRTFSVLSGAARVNANAVQIIAARSSAAGNPIPLTFAGVIGKSNCDVHVSSTACLTSNTGAYSIIGVNSVTMSGNAYTDSYNSSQGAYSAASTITKVRLPPTATSFSATLPR